MTSLFRHILPVITALIVTSSLAACDDFPNDADGTLDRVRGGTVRIGIVAQRPFAWIEDGEPRGVEVRLARQLAAGFGARIEWSATSGSAALEALRHRRLDLVVGGLTDADPWASHVAFTRPYLEYPIVAVGDAPPGDLDGRQVLVGPGTPEAAWVEEAGGIPVTATAAGQPPPLVAGPAWAFNDDRQVVALIHRVSRVFAVPKGENAWLIAVETFLAGRRAEAWQALRRHAS